MMRAAIPILLASLAASAAPGQERVPETQGLERLAKQGAILEALLSRSIREALASAPERDAATEARRLGWREAQRLAYDPETGEPLEDPRIPDARFWHGLPTLASAFDRRPTRSEFVPVPGSGVLFSFEVPVRLVPESAAAEGEAPPRTSSADAEWERARRAVEHDPFGSLVDELLGKRRPPPAALQLDPAEMRRVEAAVIETLGRHGHRLTAIGEPGTFTIALRFVTTRRTLVPSASTNVAGTAPGYSLEARALPKQVLLQVGKATLDRIARTGRPDELPGQVRRVSW